MFKEWIAVAIGGMLGTVARHSLYTVGSLIGPGWLPAATLIANVVGCFAIGWLAQWAATHQNQGHWLEIGLRVGVLGGLTTFSSFGLEVMRFWQSQRTDMALLLVFAHLGMGLAAVAVGMSVAEK